MYAQTESLPEDLRKEAFATLVRVQDDGVSVKESRAAVAGRFALTAEQVEQVEREGLDKKWPPLD